jgi:hypothetical protein
MVRTVAAGDALLDPRITRRLIQEAVSGPAPDSSRAALSSLTDREVEVLEQVARGRSNAEIAALWNRDRGWEVTIKTRLRREGTYGRSFDQVTTSAARGMGSVVVASLNDHDIVCVDEVDQPVFFRDSPRPSAGERMP